MSWMNRLSPPESEFTDDEWGRAYFQVCSEMIREGYTRAEAESRADDLTVADQAAFNQRAAAADAEAARADRLIKARKEAW